MQNNSTDTGNNFFQEEAESYAKKVTKEYRIVTFLAIFLALFLTWIPIFIGKDYQFFAQLTTTLLITALLLLLKEILIFARLKDGLYGTDKREARAIIKNIEEKHSDN